MADLEAVIGLEIHVQLSTQTKMFCGCELSFGDQPNVHTCPICLAHPGVLPVPNEEAIRYALQIAVALECEVAPRSIFHRKNYFYPDSPKAYQISQYDIPLASSGRLGEVRIHRAHLEEDAAKMIHVGESGRIHGSGASLVDFNRGGTPLVEIVTEPDLRSAAEAAEWARLLRTTIRQLGVSDVNMEEGSLRCDANVSVRPVGQRGAGYEDRAEEHEQLPLLAARDRSRAGPPARADRGGRERRSGDPPLRPPERLPDLAALQGGGARLSLLPRARPGSARPDRGDAARGPRVASGAARARIERYREEMGLAPDAAALLAADPETAAYFEKVVETADGVEPRIVANWVTGELAAALRQDGDDVTAVESKVEPASLAALVAMVQKKRISHGSGKTVLATLVAEGGDPGAIVERRASPRSPTAASWIDRRRRDRANPEAAAQIRNGNEKAIGAIVGAVMRETKGRADGGQINRLIKEQLARS